MWYDIILRNSDELVIYLDFEAEDKYLTVKELGNTLTNLCNLIKGKQVTCDDKYYQLRHKFYPFVLFYKVSYALGLLNFI